MPRFHVVIFKEAALCRNRNRWREIVETARRAISTRQLTGFAGEKIPFQPGEKFLEAFLH